MNYTMNEPKETDCNWQSIEYTQVSRDRETAGQLLTQDETINVFQGNRFKRRRWNVVTTALLILTLTTALGGFVFLVATGAMASLIDRPESSDTAMSSFSNANLEHTKVSQCAPGEVVLHEHSFEGLVRPSDKDLSGTEFLMKDPCGRSPVEARARGCRFGMLYYSWLPEECYDEQIEEEWKTFNDWKYWLYPNRTGEVSWDEAATGEYDVLLVDWENHQRHCVDIARKFYRAVTGRGLLSIDSVISEPGHFEHCSEIVMDRKKPLHDLNSIQWLKYPDCGVLHW